MCMATFRDNADAQRERERESDRDAFHMKPSQTSQVVRCNGRLSPTCSPMAQDWDVLKNGQFVCLPWQQLSPPSLPIPCQLPKWTQRCERRGYWCGKSPSLFLFFCPPVILSFSLFHFSVCIHPTVSLSLLHYLSRFRLSVSVFLRSACRHVVLLSLLLPWSPMSFVVRLEICICVCVGTYAHLFGFFPEVRQKSRSDCSNHAHWE